MRGLISLSASREKKQRQGGTPTDRSLTARQQADQTRRKTIQYTVIGVVVAVLVAALLIWNSGFFQARTTAVKVGGTSYTAAQASYFYHGTQNYQMITNPNYAGYFGYDTNKSPAEQTYTTDEETGEVTTFHDFFLDAALSEMSSVTARYEASLADTENGVTAADVQKSVDANVDAIKSIAKQSGMSYKQYLKAYYGSYMTPSVFEDCLTRQFIANQYYNEHLDGLEYTAEQLDAYYGEHKDDLDTFQYSYLYFTPDAVETKDADGNDIEMTDEEKQAKEEENLAAAKAKADEAAEAIEDGTSVADAISEFEPTTSGEDTENEGSAVTGSYAEWLKSADRKAGDVTVVEDSTNGYYVVVFGERQLLETPTAATRHILIQAEMDSGASAPTDEQMAAAKAKAEELLDQWKAGAATEDSFAELANANSDDGGSNWKGGLYRHVYEGQFVTNYNEWLFDGARQSGDTDIVENKGSYYGYHVVYYVQKNQDFYTWMAKAESSLASEDTQTWLEGLMENYAAEQASGAKYLGQ